MATKSFNKIHLDKSFVFLLNKKMGLTLRLMFTSVEETDAAEAFVKTMSPMVELGVLRGTQAFSIRFPELSDNIFVVFRELYSRFIFGVHNEDWHPYSQFKDMIASYISQEDYENAVALLDEEPDNLDAIDTIEMYEEVNGEFVENLYAYISSEDRANRNYHTIREEGGFYQSRIEVMSLKPSYIGEDKRIPSPPDMKSIGQGNKILDCFLKSIKTLNPLGGRIVMRDKTNT